MSASSVFNTDRRIRLGIWGLGRGMAFYETAAALSFDVVAGCDYNEHMRRKFLEANPGAFATADADEFLQQDFDAVLLATFCTGHAADALRCLAAGKHVLSEVTAFFTLSEGVELVAAVETSGLVYNLAENYPFIPVMRYLKRKWDEGLFGDLMYAEFEYVHECRSLAYTYIDGVPVEPGDNVHAWRSWLNFHYY
jgi:predicted dehydrogenase